MELRDRDILERLLTLIEKNECKLALKAWSDYRHQMPDHCEKCAYTTIKKNVDCCMCLESKLRTLSLYEHGCDTFERSLLNAARKLDQYQHLALET